MTQSAICGTDLHAFRGEIPDFATGTILGHEFVGTVVESGDEVPFGAGDRVLASDIVACGRCPACARGWHYHCPHVTLFGYSTVVGPALPGGQAELVRVPFADVVLSRCPDDLTDEQVLFVGDILTTALTAVVDAGVGPGDVVAIIGAGPVGLLAAMCARVAGAALLIVVDLDERRRKAAAALGLVAVGTDQLEGAFKEAGVDGAERVIEAVGSDAALRVAIGAAGPRATVVAVGAHHADAMPFPSGMAFARELRVRFAVGNPIAMRDRAIALVRSGSLSPLAIVSHRMPLSEIAAGYALFDARRATKIVVIP